MKFWTFLFALFLAVASLNAEAARRMGGGGSFGKQSSNVAQRQARATPSVPAQGANNAASPATPAAPDAAAPKRPWGAMLGGLAAGLGLAWLMNSVGMGEGMGQILMFALLAMAVMMAVGWFMRRRAKPAAQVGGSPFAFQGAGHGPVADAKPYRPENVGNDASARPWERNSTAFVANQSAAAAGGSIIGSALGGSQNWGVPAGFDADGFVTAAKRNFVTLQDAWDRSDIPALRAMMTDDMLAEIRNQLAEREQHTAGQPNKTDVVMLEAQLLGIEDLGDAYMASVEFNGMIREQPSAGPSPFREVWNMTKPKEGGGWLVAGVQALQ